MKNLKNLGTVLSTREQKSINGGFRLRNMCVPSNQCIGGLELPCPNNTMLVICMIAPF